MLSLLGLLGLSRQQLPLVFQKYAPFFHYYLDCFCSFLCAFSSEVGLALTHIFLIRVFSCQGSQQSVCQKSLLPFPFFFFDKLTRQNGALLMPLTIFHSVLKLTQKKSH